MTYEKNVPTQQTKATKIMRFPKADVYSGRTESDSAQATKGTQTSQRLTFPKSARLLKSSEYQRLRQNSRRFAGQSLVIYYQLSSRPDSKLGITVTKKFGNAVKRNLFKRRVREAFRQCRHQLPPGIQLNVLPRKDPTYFSLSKMREDFQKCTNR